MRRKSMYTSNTKRMRTRDGGNSFISRTTRSSTNAGFTLIELLVVIAIIGLLLAIIVPSLRIAKEKGSMAVCLYNVRQFSTAWFTYKEEHDGKLVNPDVKTGGWVLPPLNVNEIELKPDQTSPEITEEDEKRGIERGIFSPYVKSYDVYHCPGDNIRKSRYDSSKIFRTYAIAHCLGMTLKKYNEIKMPGMRYNFVEEAECRNFNVGTWSFRAPTTAMAPNSEDQGWRWQDPVGVNHGQSGVLGYCDGHAETHKWIDPWTKDRIMAYYNDPARTYGYGTFEDLHFPGWQFTDLNYMGQGWADRSFTKIK